jgi:hypothetical protein
LIRLLGEVLLLALGVMITPSSIALVIMLLLERRAIFTPAAFIAGRLLAMFLIVFSALIFFRNVDFSPSSAPSTASSVAKVVLGILILLLGLLVILRKSTGEEAGWLQRRMGSVERFSPVQACVLGFSLVLLSPRYLLITLAASTSILHADVSIIEGLIALLVFLAFGNLGVFAPLVVYIASPDNSAARLDAARQWMLAHERALAFSVLMIVGAYLVIRGILDLL